MAKVVEEIDRVYADLDGNLTVENLFQFSYLDWVIKEVMRINPVFRVLGRESIKPVTVLDRAFPPKTFFNLSVIAIHRDPHYWPNPMPFGNGSMVCIGQKMANIERGAS
ncbi:cytochrome P450 [Entophlyctis helioformis]|nr:cytochrome P450 [Entophlyctis helioformis]